jgi:hypothetical protein
MIAYLRLEPYDGTLSRTVLRRERAEQSALTQPAKRSNFDLLIFCVWILLFNGSIYFLNALNIFMLPVQNLLFYDCLTGKFEKCSQLRSLYFVPMGISHSQWYQSLSNGY